MYRLFLILLLIAGGSGLYAQPAFYNETVPSSALKKEKNKDITLFYVYQEGCSWCDRFQQGLATDKEMNRWLRRHCTLIAHNALLPENRTFLQQYNLSLTPSVVWYNHNDNISYTYENASDVTALYLALLRTGHARKYAKTRRKRLGPDPSISDALSASLFTHLDISAATNEARQARITYDSIHIRRQHISPLLCSNCDYLQCSLRDELGLYLYEKRQAFASVTDSALYRETYSDLLRRSNDIAYQYRDEDLFGKCIELEQILRNTDKDSLRTFRKLEFYAGTGMHTPYRELAAQVQRQYHNQPEVLYKLSVQWHRSYPEDLAGINALAARCVYLENKPEYRLWYARILRDSGYTEEARLLETGN